MQKVSLCLDVAVLSPPLPCFVLYIRSHFFVLFVLVVLSSTWRLKDDKVSEIEAALAKHGVSIAGATSNREMLAVDNQRVDEIGEYLQRFEQETSTIVRHWIAIDDLPLDRMAIEGRSNAPGNRLTAEHFVRTSDATGLTEELAQEAVKKLTAM